MADSARCTHTLLRTENPLSAVSAVPLLRSLSSLVLSSSCEGSVSLAQRATSLEPAGGAAGLRVLYGGGVWGRV